MTISTNKPVISIKKKSFYKNAYSLFAAAVIIVCAFSFFVSISKNRLTIVNLLPFVYSILVVFCKANRKAFRHISILLMNIVFFSRYCFYPLIIILSNQNLKDYSDFVPITMMIAELLGSFLIIQLFSEKLLKTKGSKKRIDFGVFSFSLFISFFACCLIAPELLGTFNFTGQVASQTGVSSASNALIVLFSVSTWTFFVGCLIIVNRMPSKDDLTNKVKLVFSLIIGLVYIMVTVIGNNNVRRWGILATGFSFAFLLTNLLPNKKKTIVFVMSLGILLGIVIGGFFKFGIQSSINVDTFNKEFINVESLDEYLAGIKNIRKGLNMISRYPEVKSFNCTLTDLFGQIPLVSKLFRGYDSVTYFHLYSGRQDDIIPLAVQSYAHFGYLGTPLFAMLLSFLALKFNSVLYRTKNIFTAFVVGESVVYLSVFMCININIELSSLWIKLFFVLIMHLESHLFGLNNYNKHVKRTTI